MKLLFADVLQSPQKRELLKILDEEGVTPVFQPIVDVINKRSIGYEALVRGPESSPLHWPMRLFEVAEEERLLVELEKKCRTVSTKAFLRSSRCDQLLFLNVSPIALQSADDQPRRTAKMLKRFGINSDQVVIELSEKYLVEDPIPLQRALRQYRESGFRIALDDVGAGYSSLKLWSEFDPDIVKLDRYFVIGIEQDLFKQQFVRTLLELGERTNTKMIVEGVETESELAALSKLGMTYAQGYLFGYPSANPDAEINLSSITRTRNVPDSKTATLNTPTSFRRHNTFSSVAS